MFPVIGNMAINDIRSGDITSLVKPVIAKGTIDVAHRLQADISAVFCHAIANDLIDYDPAQAIKNTDSR